MRRVDFEKLPNFSYREMFDHFIGKGFYTFQARREIEKVKFSFMKKLQAFRILIGRPVRFNCLTEGKHVRGSVHGLGLAGDVRIGGRGAINWNKMFQFAVSAGFKGIGWYPNWKPNKGLHLDDRPGLFKMWKRIRVNGKKVYRGLI